MQTLKIQAAQERLIAAIDAGDAQDIMLASNTLSTLIDELRDTPALYASQESHEAFARIDQLSNAAAHRLRVLTDNTRQRLHLLGHECDQLGYGPRVA